MPEISPDFDKAEYAIGRLTELDKDPATPKNEEAFDRLPNQDKSRFIAIFAIALLGGLLRWPIPTTPHTSGTA
jgi:hypothetical protein